MDFTEDRILIAHNTSFDIPFLNAQLEKCTKKKLSNHVLCTNVMTKYLLPEIVSSNLSYLCDLFGIPLKAHRALEDAQGTAELLLRYLSFFIHKDIRKINQLYYPQNKFELDRFDCTHKEEKKLLELLQGSKNTFYLMLKDKGGLILGSYLFNQQNSNTQSIIEKIQKIDWDKATLNQVGSLSQGFMQLNSHFHKMSFQAKENTLSQFKQNQLNLKSTIPSQSDLLAIPHLISGQYVLYNLKNLKKNQQLVFKYPGHEKKLHHFIRTKVLNTKKTKGQPLGIHPELLPIAHEIISKDLSQKGYFSFNSLWALENKKDFMDELKISLKADHNLYNFPQQYLEIPLNI